MSGPINPNNIGKVKREVIPEEVFVAFNELIATKFTCGSARIKQDEVITRLGEMGIARQVVFAKGWLNVEEAYEAEGWKVEYDKPAYNESYDAFFIFRK